jgi:hypothetical protein
MFLRILENYKGDKNMNEKFEKIYKSSLRELQERPITIDQALNALNEEPKTAVEALEMMIIAVIGLEKAHLKEAEIPLINKGQFFFEVRK